MMIIQLFPWMTFITHIIYYSNKNPSYISKQLYKETTNKNNCH